MQYSLKWKLMFDKFKLGHNAQIFVVQKAKAQSITKQ